MAQWFLLLAAGIASGALGSSAGLASLTSYPALLLIGLAPVTANVTNTVALVGIAVGAAAGSRPELAGQGPAIRRWLPLTVLGGFAGAVLLLELPGSSFEVAVPVIVAASGVLLLLSPRIRAAAARRSSDLPPTLIGASMLCIGVYAGYFGAAAGVMLLALLLTIADRGLPAANALKNLLLGSGNAVAALTFALTADVRWAAVLPLAIGCLAGGTLGPVVVRHVPETPLRIAISVAALALAGKLALDLRS